MIQLVDPHLSEFAVSSHLHYADWVMTVQLECFAGHVHLIRVFEWSSAYK